MAKAAKTIRTDFEKGFITSMTEATGILVDAMTVSRKTIATKVVYCVEFTDPDDARRAVIAALKVGYGYRPEQRGARTVLFWQLTACQRLLDWWCTGRSVRR